MHFSSCIFYLLSWFLKYALKLFSVIILGLSSCIFCLSKIRLICTDMNSRFRLFSQFWRLAGYQTSWTLPYMYFWKFKYYSRGSLYIWTTYYTRAHWKSDSTWANTQAQLQYTPWLYNVYCYPEVAITWWLSHQILAIRHATETVPCMTYLQNSQDAVLSASQLLTSLC